MIAKFCSIIVLVNEYTFAGNKNLVPFANSLLAIFDMSLGWCIKLTFLGALNLFCPSFTWASTKVLTIGR